MKCKDPCPGSCGLNAECYVQNHIPQCTCLQGYVGNPFVSCYIQIQCKNDSYLYQIVNNNNVFLIFNFISNSKIQNYVNCNLFNVKIIYYNLDFKYIIRFTHTYQLIKFNVVSGLVLF